MQSQGMNGHYGETAFERKIVWKWIVHEVDDKEYLTRLFDVMYDELPAQTMRTNHN